MDMRPDLLSLVLLWASVTQAEVLVQPDFDAKKFSGLWHVVSMVSDCKVFLKNKDHLLMSTVDVNATVKGDLEVHIELPRRDGCKRMDVQYLKVGSEGHFKVPALGYLDVRVADTDYSSFAVIYIYKELEGALSTMAQLYSRTQDATLQALQAFENFYPTLGLQADMVVRPPGSDVCSLGQWSTLMPLESSPSPTQVGHMIEGFWREVGVASDKDLALRTPRRAEGVFLTVNGSSLTVKVVFNNSKSCETETTVGWRSGAAENFAFPGHREIHVLDTDYQHYAILRMSLLWRGKDFHVLKYFTRSLEGEDEQGFRKFRELTADTGLYLVAQHGTCAELLKEGLI